MARDTGGSTLAHLAAVKRRNVQAAQALGLTPTPTVPAQSKGLRGSTPPMRTTEAKHEDELVSIAREFLEGLGK